MKAAGGGCLQRGKGGKSSRDGERQKAAALGEERKIGRGDMFKRLRGRWIRGGVERERARDNERERVRRREGMRR